jgi:hypothetical protein
MKTQIVPTQITTIEDKIVGNFNLVQLFLLQFCYTNQMKSPGLLVLDAHKTPFDIFRTATWLRKKYPNKKIHLPVAGYFPYVPVFKNIFKFYSEKRDITIHPVYRKIEKTSKNIPTRIYCSYYPEFLTDEKKDKLNKKYLETVKKAIHSENEIVLLSPYGGCTYYGQKVKYGAKMLIAEQPKILLAKTRLKTKTAEIKITDAFGKKLDQKLKNYFDNL